VGQASSLPLNLTIIFPYDISFRSQRMDGLIRRRRLPHLDVDGATYFVTACLNGSVPACGLKALRDYRKELDSRERPSEFSESDWRMRNDKLYFPRMESWLDDKPAVKHFVHETAADSVRDSLFHFVDKRYHLMAYCVMPSHLHLLFTPRPSWCDEVAEMNAKRVREANARQPANQPRFGSPREIIMHSLKSFTGLQCNRLLGLSGTFWQDESYDHVVRDRDELFRIIGYIEQNPVKAGLVTDPLEWKWDSAVERIRCGLQLGDPLILKQR